MALVLNDRVKETSTTTGTGTYDLAGAVTGFQGFVAGIGTGNTCWYAATDGTDWEVGIGTVTDATPDTLARTTILQSSNADAAVNWGAGTKQLVVTLPASKTYVGPDTATDNAVVRFDGTSGEVVQNSTFTIADNGDPTITVANEGATGVIMTTMHESTTPAVSDAPFQILINGRDSGAAIQRYAAIYSVILDPTAASEDGRLALQTVVAGTNTDHLYVDNGIVTLVQGQLRFPATQNASADANTLDDYEEGSWTPVMTFGGSSTGVTYSSQAGSYTKIGRLVTVSAFIVLTSNGTGTGTALVTGLPFTSGGFGAVGSGRLGAGGSAATGLRPRVNGSATTISLEIPGAVSDALATDTNCTDTFNYTLTVTYEI